MDLDLARIYGTPGQKIASAAQEEQLEKQAQAELFAKLAADNGIDLGTLSDDQIGGLWENTFGQKLAEDETPEHEKAESKAEEKDEDKKKKASEELAELQDENQKLAFADQAGRVMAHAMVQELNSINESTSKEAMSKVEIGAKLRRAGVPTTMKNLGTKAKEIGGKLKDIATAKDYRQGRQAVKNINSDIGTAFLHQKAFDEVRKGHPTDVIKGNREFLTGAAEKAKRHGAIQTGALYGGALAAGGTAAAIHHHNKNASAIDQLALDMAVEKVAEAGWDMDEAGDRLAAVVTLGLGESEKIASAPYGDVNTAVEIRSLEFLEAAGYPVEWA